MDDDEDEEPTPVPATTEGDAVAQPTTGDVPEKPVDSASTGIPKSQTLQAQKSPQPRAPTTH
jgi:hypothetical protein